MSLRRHQRLLILSRLTDVSPTTQSNACAETWFQFLSSHITVGIQRTQTDVDAFTTGVLFKNTIRLSRQQSVHTTVESSLLGLTHHEGKKPPSTIGVADLSSSDILSPENSMPQSVHHPSALHPHQCCNHKRVIIYQSKSIQIHRYVYRYQ